MDFSRLNDAAGDLASSLAQAIVLPFNSLRRLRLRHARRGSKPQRGDPVKLHEPAGYLVAIGGGAIVDDIVVRLIHLAGGRQARICIVPTASKAPEASFERYSAYFTRFGADNVFPSFISERTDALDPEIASEISESDLVFLGGGNQSRLVDIIGGTPAATALQQLYHGGGVVAGTSAGASAFGELMPAGGDGAGAILRGEEEPGNEPIESGSAHPIAIRRGFALAPSLFIDQHFVERGRLGRLLYAVPRFLGEDTELLGVGLSESTAAVVHPEGRLEFIGAGVAIIVDGRSMTYTSLTGTDDPAGERALPLSAFDLTVHLLREGQWFDLETRRPLGSAAPAAVRASAPSRSGFVTGYH